jgi:hypothetical protein
MSKQW